MDERIQIFDRIAIYPREGTETNPRMCEYGFEASIAIYPREGTETVYIVIQIA